MDDSEIEKITEMKMKSLREKKDKDNPKDPLVLTCENFDQMIDSNELILVDFWAEWCSPCRFMHPIFEKLAAKYREKIMFGRLNVDENSEIAIRYQVSSIPTFLMFVKSKPADVAIGSVGEKELEKFILQYVKI